MRKSRTENGTSLGFYPVVGRNGEVAFWTRKESGLRNGEIFLSRNGSLISVAKPDAQFLDLGGPFEDPSIGAHGNVVFWNQTVDDIGPHDAITEWHDGTYTTRVFTPEGSITGLPGGGPSINASGEVAFYGQTTIGPEYFHLGIYKATATGITPIAVTGELFSGGFTGAPSINDQGVVAFKGGLASGMLGVFKGTGDVTVCVADTSGPFLNFSGDGTSGTGTPSINNLGTVAFFGLLKNGRDGIFTGPDPTADKVIMSGDALDGSTVDGLVFWRDGLNNNGQLAFWAKLADGREGVYRADIVPEPISLLLLALGGLAAMRQKR